MNVPSAKIDHVVLGVASLISLEGLGMGCGAFNFNRVAAASNGAGFASA